MTTKTTDPTAQLADAYQKLEDLRAALPGYENAAAKANTAYEEAKERHDRVRGDHLIGTANDATLAKSEAALKDADTARVTAEAFARKTKADVEALTDSINRLAPEVYRARVEFYRNRHAELANALHAKLEEIVVLNDALHTNRLNAEREFPDTTRRGIPLGYKPAAGLPRLAWRHFRPEGYLYTWKKSFADFIDPPEPKPVRPMRMGNIFDPEPGPPPRWHGWQSAPTK